MNSLYSRATLLVFSESISEFFSPPLHFLKGERGDTIIEPLSLFQFYFLIYISIFLEKGTNRRVRQSQNGPDLKLLRKYIFRFF